MLLELGQGRFFHLIGAGILTELSLHLLRKNLHFLTWLELMHFLEAARHNCHLNSGSLFSIVLW
jgi:hypothetical protein